MSQRIFQNVNSLVLYWDNSSWISKSILIENHIFGSTLYKDAGSPEFWYMLRKNGGITTIITQLNIPKYSEDMNATWKVAEKMGIAIVPQRDGDGFRYIAMDLQKSSYYGTLTDYSVMLYEKNHSGISRKRPQDAICLAGLISVMELSE